MAEELKQVVAKKSQLSKSYKAPELTSLNEYPTTS